MVVWVCVTVSCPSAFFFFQRLSTRLWQSEETFGVRIFCYSLDVVPRFVIAVKMSGAVTLYQTEVVSLLVVMEPTMFCHGLVMFWLADVPSCWHADSCNFVVVVMKFGYAMWWGKKKIWKLSKSTNLGSWYAHQWTLGDILSRLNIKYLCTFVCSATLILGRFAC